MTFPRALLRREWSGKEAHQGKDHSVKRSVVDGSTCMDSPTGSQGAGYGKGYQKDGQWPTAPGADDGGNASDSWSTISEMNEQ